MLYVAVTGHRPNRMPPQRFEQLEPKLHGLLARLAAAAHRLYAPAPVALHLTSALAEGADRLVAHIGLGLGYSLRALLPFSPAHYRERFSGTDSCDQFDSLLAQAHEVTVLPQLPQDSDHQAYTRLGHNLLEGADVLLAVWDGRDSQGPGGTADVVRSALVRGLPVLHVCSRTRRDPVLLWNDDDPRAPRHRAAPSSYLCDEGALDAMLARKLLQRGGCC